MANNVCVAGQLLLLDLIEHLEPYCKLIQSNTDGLFLKLNSMDEIDKIKAISKSWESRVRLNLEWDLFSKIYQKDVNNYTIINDQGKYKSKGAYIKKLANIDYDLPILNKALVNYFMNGKPVEDTVMECNDLREFQKIVKVSRLYGYATYGDTPLKEKVLRIYASTDKDAPGVFKVKAGNKIERMANCPDHAFIHNDTVKGVAVPDYLDKQYYVDFAKKRLNDFLDPKSKKTKTNSDIKYVSAEILDEVLSVYEKGHKSFVDFLVDIVENTYANRRQLDILTTLNYFEDYGGNKKLLAILDEFKKKYKKQNKSKDKALAALYEYEVLQPDESLRIVDQLKAEKEYLGFFDTTSLQIDPSYAILTEVNNIYSPKLTVYFLNSGETKTYKMSKPSFFSDQGIPLCSQWDIIKIKSIENRPKTKKVDGKWIKLDETEEWIVGCSISKSK